MYWMMLVLLFGCATHTPMMDKKHKDIAQPMPRPTMQKHDSTSLWSNGSQHFLNDQRAQNIGDSVLVNINLINEHANIIANSEKKSSGKNLFGVTKFLGAPVKNVSKLLDMNGKGSFAGKGNIARSESVKLKIAATVIDILPNGNFIIYGHQEVQIDGEVRYIMIKGIIRPEDIDQKNIVHHKDIAEARITYGGKGDISDQQKINSILQFVT